MLSEPDEASRRELEIREAEASQYEERYTSQHGSRFTGVEVAVLRAALALKPSDVLADFGCGTGRITRPLAPYCRRVVAIDRSHQSLEILRKRAKADGLENISLVEADLTKAMTIEAEVTKAVCVEVLQHVLTPEGRRTVVENIRRSLVPGGRCGIVNEAYGIFRQIRGRPREVRRGRALFFHTFTSSELRSLLTSAGLTPRRMLGCGVLYWSRYRFAPRALAVLDEWAALLPGAERVAKFSAVIGEKT